MDKEQYRKKISKYICERCDYFDGRACTVNITGECNLAKESAESIIADGIIIMGYGTLVDLIERLKYESAMTFKKDEHELVCAMIDRVVKECMK